MPLLMAFLSHGGFCSVNASEVDGRTMFHDRRSRVLAVIIGRSGSKGLPGKNSMRIPLLADAQPVVTYSIRAAKASSTIDRIIVSTDGAEICDAAMKESVEVIHRPPELATDTATVDAAVRHAVDESGDAAEIIVILYANVPVRPDDLIDRAVTTLGQTKADSVQSYCDVGKYHPYWMVTLDGRGRVVPHVNNTVYRRQDLPRLLIPDGGVIAVTRQSLFTVIEGQPHAFLGTDRRGIVDEAGSVIDIDCFMDAIVAGATILSSQGMAEVSIASR
jgi:CMP-N-acetylneuraminic acid synthetase